MSPLLNLEDKTELILASEQKLAGNVALEAVDRPILASWMILIPIFFVFYYFQLRRYKNGLKDFQRSFMVTRIRALDAACDAVASGSSVDIEALADVSDSPEQLKSEYKSWLMALVEYYQVLLQAEGDSFAELVRNSHKNKTNYLLSINRIGQAERSYDEALIPHLPGDQESIHAVVKKMEHCTEEYRRELGSDIFS